MSFASRQRVRSTTRYALSRTALATLLSLALATLTGTGWVGVEYVLFTVGILVSGYGSLQARPAPAWRDQSETSKRRSGFQILLTGICILGLSLGIERLLVV